MKSKAGGREKREGRLLLGGADEWKWEKFIYLFVTVFKDKERLIVREMFLHIWQVKLESTFFKCRERSEEDN